MQPTADFFIRSGCLLVMHLCAFFPFCKTWSVLWSMEWSAIFDVLSFSHSRLWLPDPEHPPLFKKSLDSVPTDHNSKRLLQIHLLSSDNNTLERPTTPHTHPAYLGTVQYSCLPGSPLHSLDTSICFYLLTLLTLSIALYKLISPTFFCAFIPSNTL